MTKKFIILSAFLFCAISIWSQEESVKGIYFNTEKSSKIKIFKATNGKYYGKIVWMEEPEKKDVENPDASKHDDPIMGMLIIKDFSYDANKNQWSGGKIYDPGNGKTYDCYMWFDEGESKLLNVKGYVLGMKFVGRQVQWERTDL